MQSGNDNWFKVWIAGINESLTFLTTQVSDIFIIGIIFLNASDNIVDFEFRHLRDTWASQIALSGVHPKAIQRMGGWATIKQVMKYINLTDEEIQKAEEIIEERLSNETAYSTAYKNIAKSS